jgi:hypothetical protein
MYSQNQMNFILAQADLTDQQRSAVAHRNAEKLMRIQA